MTVVKNCQMPAYITVYSILHYLCHIGHDKRQLCVHGSVANEVSIFDCIFLDEVSLSMRDETTDKHSVGLHWSLIGVVPIIFQKMKLVVRIREVDLTSQWEIGKPLQMRTTYKCVRQDILRGIYII